MRIGVPDICSCIPMGPIGAGFETPNFSSEFTPERSGGRLTALRLARIYGFAIFNYPTNWVVGALLAAPITGGGPSKRGPYMAKYLLQNHKSVALRKM